MRTALISDPTIGDVLVFTFMPCHSTLSLSTSGFRRAVSNYGSLAKTGSMPTLRTFFRFKLFERGRFTTAIYETKTYIFAMFEWLKPADIERRPKAFEVRRETGSHSTDERTSKLHHPKRLHISDHQFVNRIEVHRL